MNLCCNEMEIKKFALAAGLVTLIGILGVLLIPQGDSPEFAQDSQDGLMEEPANASPNAKANTAPNTDRQTWRQESGTESVQWQGPPDRSTDLHGIVLGPDGQLVAGCLLTVTRPDRQGVSTLDLTRNRSTKLIDTTFSSQNGEFRIPLKPGSLYDLEASADGLQSPMIKGCQAGERVVVRLEASSSVEGTLLSASDKQPQQGVRLRMFRPGGKGRRYETKSDADGRYLFSGLTQGKWYLEVIPDNLQPPNWEQIEAEPGTAYIKDFTLELGTTISGRVIDAVTQSPIANAEISNSWVFRRISRSDADGMFQIHGLNSSQGNIGIHARASGYGVREFQLELDSKNPILKIELLPSRIATGTIVDQNGAPIERAYVAAVGNRHGRGQQRIDWPSTFSSAEGAFEIANIRPDIPHTLQIQKAGFGSILLEFPPDEQDRQVIHLGEIALPEAGEVGGACQGEDGVGIAGVQVKLTGWNNNRSLFGRELDTQVNLYVGEVTRTTDDLGRFLFTDLADGTYALSATRDQLTQVKPLAIELGKGEQRTNLKILIPEGESIGGVVMKPDGLPFPGATVELNPDDDRGYEYAFKKTDENGRFQFNSVLPGLYRLTASPPYDQEPVGENQIYLSTEIDEVSSGQMNLTLTLSLGQTISGQVYDSHGNPAARIQVSAHSPDGARLAIASTGQDGEFTLRLSDNTIVNIEARQTHGRRTLADGSQSWVPLPTPRVATLQGVQTGTSGLVIQIP